MLNFPGNMTEEITLKELCTLANISYHEDDYDNDDSIVSDVEVAPVITMSTDHPLCEDLEDRQSMSASGDAEEIANVLERAADQGQTRESGLSEIEEIQVEDQTDDPDWQPENVGDPNTEEGQLLVINSHERTFQLSQILIYAKLHARMHTCTPANTHTHNVHTHTHTHTNTRTHTHTHKHTRTHAIVMPMFTLTVRDRFLSLFERAT